MTSQQASDLIQQFYKYFHDQNTEEGHFDVTFQFGDSQQNLNAHSFILWPSSKVFEKTLFGPLAHKGPIPIIRHTYNDFKEFITYMYLGKCDITIDNAIALTDLSEYYDIQLLKQKCDTFLTQNSTKIENVLKVYECLKLYSLENAMAKVMEFVAENTVEILKSAEFLSVKKETILDIVKMKNLKAKQEDVFEAVCKWGEHNCPEGTVNKHEFFKNQLEDVITLIDFSKMDFSFLSNFVVRKGFLFPSYDALADVISEAMAKKQKVEEERLKIVPERRRIQITDSYGKKGYADISNPNIISAIERTMTNNSCQSISSYNNICQWNIHLGVPQNITYFKYILICNSNGNLVLKQYQKNGYQERQCCLNEYDGFGYYDDYCTVCQNSTDEQPIQNDDIIAQVSLSNSDTLNLNFPCKIEFI